jgi:hypothetical protein
MTGGQLRAAEVQLDQARIAAGERRQHVAVGWRKVLVLVDLSSLARPYPHQLSGGQQQRVPWHVPSLTPGGAAGRRAVLESRRQATRTRPDGSCATRHRSERAGRTISAYPAPAGLHHRSPIRDLGSLELGSAVTEEAGRLLGAQRAAMTRYDADGARTVVAAWSSTRAAFPVPDSAFSLRNRRKGGRTGFRWRSHANDSSGLPGANRSQHRPMPGRAGVLKKDLLIRNGRRFRRSGPSHR